MSNQDYIANFLSGAEVVLQAHEQLTKRGFIRLAGNPSQFEVSNTYMDVTVSMLNGMVERNKFSSVSSLSVRIARNYRASSGFSITSVESLMGHTGYSASTIKRIHALMPASGLWGKVSGQGHLGTRYYPLLSEKGYQAFVELVENAKRGIHPLYGDMTAPQEPNAGESAGWLPEASKPIPEPVDSTPAVEVKKEPVKMVAVPPEQAPRVPEPRVSQPVVPERNVPEPVVPQRMAPEPQPAVSVDPAPSKAPNAPEVSPPQNRSANIDPFTGRPYKIAKPRPEFTERQRIAREQAEQRKAKEQAEDVFTNGSGVSFTSLEGGGGQKRRKYVEYL